MKIAFIGQKGIPASFGGVEKHVEELSVRLAKRGHEVTVYTRPSYSDKNLKNFKGVNLLSLPSIRTKHLDAISHTFLACLDAIFFRSYDIIHFHSIGPSSLIWLVKLLKPETPVVATFHAKCYEHRKWNKLAKSYLKLSEYALCRFSDQVITVSKTLQIYAEKKYGIKPIYIPNGVNLPKAVLAKIIKKKWGLKKNSYLLLVSRLVAHKGIHYVIKAYQNLKTDKKLVIVGDSFFTDDYKKELLKLAGQNKNIIFTGQQSGRILAELFSNAYFFIQPSESEGMSIALLEAISYGRAVLVSGIPENLEAVGSLGFSFNSKDIDDLELKIKYLLANPDLVSSRSRQGRQYVNKNFNWENIVDDLVEVYKELNKSKEIFGLAEEQSEVH